MAFGEGKYDAVLSQARAQTRAEGGVLIIFNGEHGSGFSCQADPVMTAKLPDILEFMAKQIREDLRKL